MTVQAIETKYLPPTNTKGARIKASAQAGSVICSYQYAGTEAEHDAAFIALVNKLKWWGVWARGAKANGTGNVYVCISTGAEIRTPHPRVTSPATYVVVRAPEVAS